MAQDWNPDDDEPNGGEQGREVRSARMFTFDTDGEDIDQLHVERRASAWESIGSLPPDATKDEFYDWLVEQGYAPTAQSKPLVLRVYPVSIDGEHLVTMTGKPPRGPVSLRIPADSQDIRAAQERLKFGGAALSRSRRGEDDDDAAPVQKVDPNILALQIMRDTLAAREKELAEERRVRREEEAKRAEQQRNMTQEAVALHNNITHDGIQQLTTGMTHVLKQQETGQMTMLQVLQAQQAATQAQYQQMMLAMQQQNQAAMQQQQQAFMAMQQQQQTWTQMQITQAKEDAKNERERIAAEREREREREERRRRDDADRMEREEKRRQEAADERERIREDARIREEQAMERERERQRDHMTAQLALIEKRFSPETANASMFGQIGDLLKGLGIDPGEKLRGILSGDAEEAQESMSDLIGSVTPLAQTALGTLGAWLASRAPQPIVEAAPPPPPPRTLPEPTPILPGPVMPVADVLRGLDGQPPVPALPAPAPGNPSPVGPSPDAPPVAPTQGADTSPAADPLPPAEMRAARDGVQAILDIVTAHPEAEWDGLIRPALEAAPAAAALLKSKGVGWCVADANGPAAKVAALREHLLALGLTTP